MCVHFLFIKIPIQIFVVLFLKFQSTQSATDVPYQKRPVGKLHAPHRKPLLNKIKLTHIVHLN